MGRGSSITAGLALLALCGCPVVEPCAEGELADGDRCVPAECGTGPWGDAPDGPAVLHVAAPDSRAAGGGGDGTRERPFETVEDGFEALQARGGTLLLSEGTHIGTLTVEFSEPGEEIPLEGSIAVRGRCRAETVLTGGEDLLPFKVYWELADDAEASLSDLTVRPVDERGLVLRGGSLAVERVDVEGARQIGVALSRTRGTLVDLAVRGTSAGGSFGMGILVNRGAVVDFERLVIEDSVGSGLNVDSHSDKTATTVTLRDSLLRNLEGAWVDGELFDPGQGLVLGNGSQATVLDSRFEGIEHNSLFSGNSSLVAERVVFDGAGGPTSRGAELGRHCDEPPCYRFVDCRFEDYGVGGVLAYDTSVTMDRCTVEDPGRVGLYINGAGAWLRATDTHVRGAQASGGREAGFGVIAVQGADVDLLGGSLVGHRGVALIAEGDGTNVSAATLEGVELRDTKATPDLDVAFGLIASGASNIEVRGLICEDNEGPCALTRNGGRLRCVACRFRGNAFAAVASLGGRLLVEGDTAVDPDEPSVFLGSTRDGGPDGAFGAYLYADGSAQVGNTELYVQGSLFAPHAFAAVYAEGAGSLNMADVFIQGEAPPSRSLAWPQGGGVVVNGVLGQAQLDGVEFLDEPDPAVLMHGTTGVLLDVSVAGPGLILRQQGCALQPTLPWVGDLEPALLCDANSGPDLPLAVHHLSYERELPRIPETGAAADPDDHPPADSLEPAP